jgi:hypothetical protein
MRDIHNSRNWRSQMAAQVLEIMDGSLYKYTYIYIYIYIYILPLNNNFDLVNWIIIVIVIVLQDIFSAYLLQQV